MLDNAGQPSDSMPGDSGCVLLGSERFDESVLHSTSLLQGKCGALIMLDNVGKPCHSIPGDSGCVLLGSERVTSQSCIQPHSFKGSVGL